MRTAFILTLCHLARGNPDLFVLTGDLGYSVFEAFEKEFPGRFYDVGVAEQNMLGIAAGLAFCGKIVVVYSIIPFTTLRCFEQIRNDVCMHHANVKIIGMGAGLHYGSAGPSHHALEDVALMRSLPGMTIISPATARETEQAIRQVVERPGPAYLRIGAAKCVAPENLGPAPFEIGRACLWNDGEDMTIMSYGVMMSVAQKVREILTEQKISVRLLNMASLQPLDRDAVLAAARETGMVVTLEEHYLPGGMGSAVAEVLAEEVPGAIFCRFGLAQQFIKTAGNAPYIHEQIGLTPEKIVTRIMEMRKKKDRYAS